MSNQASTLVPQTLGLAASFGFGDRIGLATAGHVAAMHRCGTGIEPIFPQQSIREMTRTIRSATEVMEDGLSGAVQAGWMGKTGADADHLKTRQDVDVTRAAGFTFFTIDPSDFVDPQADDYTAGQVIEKFSSTGDSYSWIRDYVGRSEKLTSGTIVDLHESNCQRAVVKYGPAIAAAIELGRYICDSCEAAGQSYEIELSIDETEQPTTLAEHFIIADQFRIAGIPLISMAPRFPGDFEKGVDFKGDLNRLDQALQDHAAIAEQLGPYKLSLHSGSDKLAMYPLLARATQGRFHIKTAGTSYLEALRVVLKHEPELFRRIVEFARQRYNTDKATYHVSATLAGTPAAAEVAADEELEALYLERWCDVPLGKGFTAPGRQILHCTFGSVLTSEEWGPAVRQVLEANPNTYREVLDEHFGRHLDALREGMN